MLLHGRAQPGFWFQRVTPEPCSQCGNPRRLLQSFCPLSLAHFFPLSSIFSNLPFPPVFSLPLFLFFQPASLLIFLCFFHSSSLSPVFSSFFLSLLPPHLSSSYSSPRSVFFSHFFLVCVFLFPMPWPLSIHFLPGLPLCSLFLPFCFFSSFSFSSSKLGRK